MESFISPLLNFGIAGVMIIYFIYHNRETQRQHREERDQWREDHNGMINELKGVIENNTEAVTNLRLELKK